MPLLVAKHSGIEIVFQDETGEPRTDEQRRKDWEQAPFAPAAGPRSLCFPTETSLFASSFPIFPENVVGNLLRESVLEIWNGARNRQIYPPREKQVRGNGLLLLS